MWFRARRRGRPARPTFVPPKTVHVGDKLAIKGEIVGEEDVELAGRFEGVVVIRERAEVDAAITASTVVIGGTARGNVTAARRVVVMPPGVLRGNVRARRLVVSEGAALSGVVDIDPSGGDTIIGARDFHTSSEAPSLPEHPADTRAGSDGA